eukprot:COSAG04_NODE_26026_length_300_cov_1.019900_1_plen_43_part_01
MDIVRRVVSHRHAAAVEAPADDGRVVRAIGRHQAVDAVAGQPL